jgi:GntR family transcriptional regulator, carbon starvation induced regulator
VDTQRITAGETALDAAYESIRADLLAGRFAPDAKLGVEELCARYGLGPTPIREALSRISAGGMIVATPNRGYRVAAISHAEYRELVELRLTLEPDALARSITHGDIDWEARVAAAHHRLATMQKQLRAKAEDGLRNWAREDRGFHLALLSSCGSDWLLRFCASIYDQTARYHRDRILQGVAPVRQTEDEHRSLLDASLRRDANGAAALLRKHIHNVAARIERSLKDELGRRTLNQ